METLVAFGSEIKTLEDVGDRLKIGGYLVLFGSPELTDATHLRDYFTKATDFDIPTSGATSTVYYHHGINPTLKSRPLGKAKLSIDDAGVWMEAELQARDEYETKIQELVRQGKLGLSSGTASHLVERTAVKNAYGEEVHHIDRWPLGLDASLTPTPGEPRTMALCLKSLDEVASLGYGELRVTSGLGQLMLAEYVRSQAALSGVWFEVPAGLVEALKEWDESKHPRDEIGRWTAVARARIALSERINPRGLKAHRVDELIPAFPSLWRPHGVPIKHAIDFRHPAEVLQTAYQLIDSVHRDGKLPKIPIFFLPDIWVRGKRASGAFKINERGEVAHIEIAHDSPSRLLSTIHESGHFLDYRGLFRERSNGDFATKRLRLRRETEKQPEEWREFHRAVTGSRAWQRLVDLSNRDTIEDFDARGQKYTYTVNQDTVSYLMLEQEVFARAYAQYVAIRCPHKKLGTHLRRHIAAQAYHKNVTSSGGQEVDSLHYPRQWQKEDFEPIMLALDHIFLAHGWIVPNTEAKNMMEKQDPKEIRWADTPEAEEALRQMREEPEDNDLEPFDPSAYDDGIEVMSTEDILARQAQLEAIQADIKIPEEDYENA